MEGPSAESASTKVRRSVSKMIVKLPPRSGPLVNVDLPATQPDVEPAEVAKP
jgi:hypothetical protein